MCALAHRSAVSLHCIPGIRYPNLRGWGHPLYKWMVRMAEQKKFSFEIPVSTKLPEEMVVKVDEWADRGWRNRCQTLAALLFTILRMINDSEGFQHPLESVLSRLRLDPA